MKKQKKVLALVCIMSLLVTFFTFAALTSAVNEWSSWTTPDVSTTFWNNHATFVTTDGVTNIKDGGTGNNGVGWLDGGKKAYNCSDLNTGTGNNLDNYRISVDLKIPASGNDMYRILTTKLDGNPEATELEINVATWGMSTSSFGNWGAVPAKGWNQIGSGLTKNAGDFVNIIVEVITGSVKVYADSNLVFDLTNTTTKGFFALGAQSDVVISAANGLEFKNFKSSFWGEAAVPTDTPSGTPTEQPTTPTATNAPTVTPLPEGLAWQQIAGTWVVDGDDISAPANSQDYWKLATTTSIDGLSNVKDLTFAAKIYTGGDKGYVAGGGGGTGFFIVLRDQGTTLVNNAPSFNGIGLVFDPGTKRIMIYNGANQIADYGFGYFEDSQFVVDSQGYVDFSITLKGNKITSLKFGGTEVTGIIISGETPEPGNLGNLILPVTTAGKISVGSFTNPPTLMAGIKNVSYTVLDATSGPTDEENPPATGDNTAMIIIMVFLLASSSLLIIRTMKTKVNA